MTAPRLGIRREDKNPWERRVPLAPRHVADLVQRGLEIHVEASEDRVFPLDQYLDVGAQSSDLSTCPIVLGVKEIPESRFEREKTYVFFSHTIKGQPYNMAMLRRMIEQRVSLIDYECIVDDEGRRLVFFSRHAGLAGMVETLVAFGQRLAVESYPNPFAELTHAKDHRDLEHIQSEIRRLGKEWKDRDFSPPKGPLVCGFLGSGNVSQGALEIYDLLDPVTLSPEEFLEQFDSLDASGRTFYRVVFSRRHLVRARDGHPFDAEEYDAHPERYESVFDRYLPKMSMLINGITWRPEFPVFVPETLLQSIYRESSPQLKVVGDITCDIKGSIACTIRPSDLQAPCYVWNPETGEATDGVEGNGPVVMAVDNLPASLPIDASRSFGDSLMPFVEAMTRADYSVPFDELALPDPIKRALVLHRGEFTPAFASMKAFVSDKDSI